MGKLQVIYEDLRSSQTALGSASDALEKIRSDIEQLATDLESAGANHDDCFGKVALLCEELNDLFIEDWIEELNAIIAAMAAIIAVFTDAEGDIIDDLKDIDDKALKEALEDALGKEIPDDEKIDLTLYKDRDDYKNKKKYTGDDKKTGLDGGEKQGTDNSGVVSGVGPAPIVTPPPSPQEQIEDAKKEEENKKGKDKKDEGNKQEEDKKQKENKPEEDNKGEENKPEENKEEEDIFKNEPTIILKQILADKPSAVGVGTASAGVVGGGVASSTASTEPKEVKSEEPKEVEPEEPEEPPVETEPEVPEEEPTETEDNNSHQTIPIDTSSDKKSSGTSVVPIIAGIAAAGAAGIGTKIYLDRKSNNDNDEDDNGEDEYSYSGDYAVADNSESYLDNSDDIGYSAIKDADEAMEETVTEPLEDAEEPKDTYKAVSFDDLSETH